MPSTIHTLISLNAQWPGFSKSPAWGTRGAGFAKAIKASRASIVVAQELGLGVRGDGSYAADLASRLGSAWSYQRAQGGGKGLNCVLWRDDWDSDGATIDRNISSFGQMQRTLCAVPLEHEKGEKVTAGSSHFANRSASDLTVGPIKAQQEQAEDVHNALKDRRRVILGIDSNSPTPSFGGRGWLVQHGWRVTANGIDIVACLPGVVVQSSRLVSVPSDHDQALVVTYTTNTGPSKA